MRRHSLRRELVELDRLGRIAELAIDVGDHGVATSSVVGASVRQHSRRLHRQGGSLLGAFELDQGARFLELEERDIDRRPAVGEQFEPLFQQVERVARLVAV